MKTERFACLSGSTLKIIAMVTMLLDHIGAVILEPGFLYPVSTQQTAALILSTDTMLLIYKLNYVLRFIGRISFPIFAFLLVEGFLHTSDKKKYMFRLFLFALLSELPFDLAFQQSFLEFTYQNVMFTLLFGFVSLYLLDYFSTKPYLMALIVLCTFGLGYVFQADYDYRGLILILILYFFRHDKFSQTLFGCISLYWEPPACLGFIPIRLYNGKRGLPLKYIFYFFYPVHLLLLCLIRQIICF